MPLDKPKMNYVHELIGRYENIPAMVVGNGVSSSFYDTWRWRNSGYVLVGCNLGFKTHPLNALAWQDTGVEDECLRFRGIRVTCFRRHIDMERYNGVYFYWGGKRKYSIDSIKYNQLFHGSTGVISFQVALIMGCNPVHIVGCDCAFSGEPGRWKSNMFRDKHASIANNNPDRLIKVGDKYTMPIFQTWAKQFEMVYQQWKDYRDIWLTDGGIGIINIPRKEVDEVFWSDKHPARGGVLDGHR